MEKDAAYERYLELREKAVNYLLDSIDSGYLNEETIGQFTYRYLAALLWTCRELENGRELYQKIKNYLLQTAFSCIQKQKKTIVAFVVCDSSVWIGDGLYWRLEQSERFEPYVLVTVDEGISSEKTKKEKYIKNLAFFRDRNLRTVATCDVDRGGSSFVLGIFLRSHPFTLSARPIRGHIPRTCNFMTCRWILCLYIFRMVCKRGTM